MKILDFLMYYFSHWLESTDRRKIKTVSYLDQSAYALTICSILYLLLIERIFEFILFNTFQFKMPIIIFVLIGLFIYFIFRHIYITKGRYNQILKKRDPKFSVSEKLGRTIAIIVFISPLFAIFFVTLFLHQII